MPSRNDRPTLVDLLRRCKGSFDYFLVHKQSQLFYGHNLHFLIRQYKSFGRGTPSMVHHMLTAIIVCSCDSALLYLFVYASLSGKIVLLFSNVQ